MKTVTFSSLLADYREQKMREELASDWGSVVFYRLPAFVVVSRIAVPLGLTPTQLTVAGALLVPLVALAAWFLAPGPAMLALLLLGVLFNVLDCADGTLARATGTSSLSGRYLDFAVDILYRLTTYASLGLIADHAWPGAAFPWVAVGLCCGLLGLYARVNRIYAERLFPPSPSTGGGGRRSAFDKGFSLLSGLDTLLPIIAFLAWQTGLLQAAMIWFLLYTCADAVIELAGNYRKAARIDSGDS